MFSFLFLYLGWKDVELLFEAVDRVFHLLQREMPPAGPGRTGLPGKGRRRQKRCLRRVLGCYVALLLDFGRLLPSCLGFDMPTEGSSLGEKCLPFSIASWTSCLSSLLLRLFISLTITVPQKTSDPAITAERTPVTMLQTFEFSVVGQSSAASARMYGFVVKHG